jgi:hypothetical protein
MDFADVELPGGIRLEGNWRRDAVLRPLVGRDEEFLLQHGRALSPAARTTAVLARCLSRLGPVSRITPDIARSLTVGDREALLLQLRRLTLGEKMSCLLKCPACAEKLDLELDISELLLAPYGQVADVHETSAFADGLSYRVRFRLPNGADLEAAAAVIASTPESAAELVLRRCVQELIDANSGETVQGMPAGVVDALSERMAELDPQAEILFDLRCPVCGESFGTSFDIGDYFFREICGREVELNREIHLLAFHYHWSEREILRLSRRTRLLYLDLLSSTLSEERLQ